VSAFDVSVIVGAALLGWFAVSWLFKALGARGAGKAHPVAGSGADADTRTVHPGRQLSLAELGERWPRILDVSEDASMATIDIRFRETIAECDRIRASDLASDREKTAATARRETVVAAYEFVRAARSL
jgi:hypothetical protein